MIMERSAATATGFNVYDPSCPARQVLEHLTSRWGVLALGALQERTYRFAELGRRIDGVSEKMLAQTLRTLERDGLVRRVSYPEVPPRVEYSLTEKGREAAVLTTALVGWVEQHATVIIDAQLRHDTGALAI
jgi:DNA-binding HxlR family transcriptional regulator